MSTDYILTKPIKVEDLVKVEGLEVDIEPTVYNEREKKDIVKKNCVRVFDGQNYLWGYLMEDKNYIDNFCRYGRNDVEDIITDIEFDCDTKFISEYDSDRYWKINDERYPDDTVWDTSQPTMSS